jgi:proteic killer suppression protein
VARKFQNWQEAVQKRGLQEVRKSPGFHDEPLKDPRYRGSNCRSVRLNQSFRVIYCEGTQGSVVIQSISNHDYY